MGSLVGCVGDKLFSLSYHFGMSLVVLMVLLNGLAPLFCLSCLRSLLSALAEWFSLLVYVMVLFMRFLKGSALMVLISLCDVSRFQKLNFLFEF